MWKKLRKFIIRLLSMSAVLAILVLGFPVLLTQILSRSRIFSIENSPSAPVAIVFGAGLNFDGSPTAVLQDRVATAADLYFDGRVKKLLMTGDNRFLDYNEPGAMHSYAVELGIPEEDIVLDFGGRRTYDSCYRASAIFGVTDAILVTQRYHLPRALFLCNHLDIESSGVVAEKTPYPTRSLLAWKSREVIATLVAFWDSWMQLPPPVLGEQEPIFPDK
ncbi:MAG: YdcF family protein [Anaerolineaceae bacterium]|nr:YdcF family protein [Anaerolineaceae bacterium]